MTEVQFAKQFLTTLDSKPTKYQPDHVFNPQTFQIRNPYTLPKLAHPPHPLPAKAQPAGTGAPGSEPATSTINVSLKSSRNPNFTLNLPSLPSTTLISILRSQVQSVLSQSQSQPQIALEKIKILHNKKPIPAIKSTIGDVVSETTGSQPSDTNIEFGVMVMGGAPDPIPSTQTLNLNNDLEPSAKDVGPESEKAAAEAIATTHPLEQTKSPEPVQPGEISGREVLKTKEFWDDLQGYLEQRLRSNEVAAEVRALFQNAIQ